MRPVSIWLQRLAPRPRARARLFCFAPAGGSAAVYRLWPAGLPESLDVCAVQLPGRGNRLREPTIANIPALVEALLTALDPFLDLPFAIFGHSMGAVLGSEVARTLAAEGRPPRHLIVSARRPPHLGNAEPPLHPLPDAEFVTAINLRYGGIPPELLQHADVLELLLPSLRADMTAIETHRPTQGAPLPFPVSAFGGADDRFTPAEHLEAWRGETSAAFRSRIFPGGHFYLDTCRDDLLADIAATLAPLLEPAAQERIA